jgi:hypothetical protein
MKIKSDCKVREIAGESVVIMQGKQAADLTKIITLNESALLLWNALVGSDFTLEDATAVLVEEYAIDEALAERDAAMWLSRMQECGLVE